MQSAMNSNGNVEFRWLQVSTGLLGSIYVNGTQTGIIDETKNIIKTMINEHANKTSDLRVIHDPRWQLFGELAAAWSNSKKRVSDEEGHDISDGTNLPSADMREIVSNVAVKI